MIIHLKKGITSDQAEKFAEELKATRVQHNGTTILVTTTENGKLNGIGRDLVEKVYEFDSDIQLASADYMVSKREVAIGSQKVGGNLNNTLVIAGPCAVESAELVEKSAKFLKDLGVNALRAGSYKPRTSPYTFQGLGKKGLEILDSVRSRYGLSIVTEVKDSSHVGEVIEFADVIQVGAKAMFDYAILEACGKSNKPVMIKRGFGATAQELVQAAEFVLSGGNENVIICERGIRTFENSTRFTLDLSGAIYLKHKTNLPIFLDPSHGIGHAYGVPDLARSCMAIGVEGLLIETHPDPSNALSDSSQQLHHEDFKVLFTSLKKIGDAIGYQVV